MVLFVCTLYLLALLYSSQVFNHLIIFIVTLDMYFYLMNNKHTLLLSFFIITILEADGFLLLK